MATVKYKGVEFQAGDTVELGWNRFFCEPSAGITVQTRIVVKGGRLCLPLPDRACKAIYVPFSEYIRDMEEYNAETIVDAAHWDGKPCLCILKKFPGDVQLALDL